MVKLRPDTLDERGPTIPGSILLGERIKSRRRDWSYARADGTQVEVISGQVVSGEKLVNNQAFRDALVARFPAAIGGEMEGIGAYAMAQRRRREILLVKAICDWADGLKNDRAQAFAAATATSVVRHVLGKRDVLAPIGVLEYANRPPDGKLPGQNS
jgi:nucleoside phosphorylase